MSTFLFRAYDVSITPTGRDYIYVQLSADMSNILSEIPISKVISHFGITEILDEIDVTDAIQHYDLKIEE